LKFKDVRWVFFETEYAAHALAPAAIELETAEIQSVIDAGAIGAIVPRVRVLG
jgi:hypothetical protein